MNEFWYKPASPRPHAALRIGLALVLIAQAVLLRNDIMSFITHDGIVQGDLAEYLSESYSPSLTWLVDLLEPRGISETMVMFWATRLYFASLVLMLVGFFTRPAVIAAWFLQWALMNTGYNSSYGVDMYAHIFLFYLMVVPCGADWSVDHLLGRTDNSPSVLSRVGLRVMQIHLCVSYLASAIEKSLGVQWWNGELLWRALSLPEYKQFDMSWLAHAPWLSMVLGWTALATEGLFFILIWPKRTRNYWIALTASLHIGIALFLGLQLFGAIMCVFVISLFWISDEPVGAYRPRSNWILSPTALRQIGQ